VNGEGRAEPYTERDMPAPEDPYGNSKWEAEQALIRIASETGMEIVIIRPPLVYGPGVRANFYELLKLIQRGIPLPFADVNNRRSLIYLGNLIDAIIACSVRREAAGKTFLASDGVDVSTPELVRRIAGAFNRTVRLFSFPETIMRSAGRFIGRSLVVERLLGSLTVDTSSIQRELGWKAPYTMEQGLQETAHWFKNRYGP
jgi:nucleoside-diphosphate-sugar epimerase